jgi:pimeloyl-ACP methyl ester carboxylesterase
MRAGLRGLQATCLLAGLWISSASSADRLGIALLHGKEGSPASLQPLADSLAAAGFLVDRPEMCWSGRRIYDRPYLDCLAEVDAATARLTSGGATAIVVIGMSLGGQAALAYGARRDGLKGIVAMAPAPPVQFVSQLPNIARSLAEARALIAAGKGDIPTTLSDRNDNKPSFDVRTTPKIYVSFLAPDSPAYMPANAARLKAPLLLVTGTHDFTQRDIASVFARLPSNPLNRLVRVDADHRGTPAAGREAILSWLKALAER